MKSSMTQKGLVLHNKQSTESNISDPKRNFSLPANRITDYDDKRRTELEDRSLSDRDSLERTKSNGMEFDYRKQ